MIRVSEVPQKVVVEPCPNWLARAAGQIHPSHGTWGSDGPTTDRPIDAPYHVWREALGHGDDRLRRVPIRSGGERFTKR